MGDDQVVRLLEEIRDLQKLHVDNYRDALKNQQEAIALQKGALRRQRVALLIFGVLLAGLVAFLVWSSMTGKG